MYLSLVCPLGNLDPILLGCGLALPWGTNKVSQIALYGHGTRGLGHYAV
jgi:hypothetical protein